MAKFPGLHDSTRTELECYLIGQYELSVSAKGLKHWRLFGVCNNLLFSTETFGNKQHVNMYRFQKASFFAAKKGLVVISNAKTNYDSHTICLNLSRSIITR